MKGKTIVATGGTSGIGEVAVVALAKMGARIILIARDEQRAEQTLVKLEAAAPRAGHALHLADLSSMAETRRVGQAIAASEPRIDVLVNNAGALFSHRRVTPEGLEMTFALNHMAYFVLTEALRERLIASAPARIVSTSSDAHKGARLDFDDLQGAKSYSGFRAYSRSKLANILFTRELARRLEGTGVVANCFHPGFVAVALRRRLGGPCRPACACRQAFGDLARKGRRHARLARLRARGRKRQRRLLRQAAPDRPHRRRAGRCVRTPAVGGERGAGGRARDMMARACFLMAAVIALASPASAKEPEQPTAILVSPIHEAQVVRGDDGMDHVEYELLVVSVFSEPITLSNVTVLDPSGTQLLRIEGAALAAATQTLFAKTPSPVIPPSAAVSVDVDLIVPPGAAPERVTHKIAYTLKAELELAAMIGSPEVYGPEVAVDRQSAIAIRPPLKGNGWLATSACCKPNVHRDERIAIDGRRIETGETFAVDWARVRKDRLFDGDGKKAGDFYGFGEDVLAVADGVVVGVHDGMADQTPFVAMAPRSREDYGGNNVMIEIAPKIFAWYAHLRQGSIAVKIGDRVKAGAPIAKLGNTGPSQGPHLHFGLLDRPDPLAGRSLPFVLDRFTLTGTVDLDASEADRLIIAPDSREIRSAYPLYGGIQNFPDAR